MRPGQNREGEIPHGYASVPAAARLLRRDRVTIHRWMKTGALASTKFGERRVIPVDAVAQHMSRRIGGVDWVTVETSDGRHDHCLDDAISLLRDGVAELSDLHITIGTPTGCHGCTIAPSRQAA